MSYNYKRLKSEIVRVFGTQDAFATAMGLSATSLSYKLNGKSEWTQDEMGRAVKSLGHGVDEIPYFFYSIC